jgi:hypothetical protein
MSQAYVLSYFTTAEESLHLAVSLDGITFTAVDGGREILRGQLSSGTLRDPFIGVGPDGLFHLLATDGWESNSIVHAVSSDLLAWGPQKLLPVMASVPGALNSWAPEFFIEPDTNRARLIWSSVVDPHPLDGPQGALPWNARHQAIWSCTTTDFGTLSSSSVYFDPGFSVIDASVLVESDGLLMAYKDERGEPLSGGEHNRIHVRRIAGSETLSVELGAATPSPTEGPTLYRRGDEIVMLFDHYLEGRYGAVSSADGVGWSESSVRLPADVRHASVLTLDSSHPALVGLAARTVAGNR